MSKALVAVLKTAKGNEICLNSPVCPCIMNIDASKYDLIVYNKENIEKYSIDELVQDFNNSVYEARRNIYKFDCFLTLSQLLIVLSIFGINPGIEEVVFYSNCLKEYIVLKREGGKITTEFRDSEEYKIPKCAEEYIQKHETKPIPEGVTINEDFLYGYSVGETATRKFREGIELSRFEACLLAGIHTATIRTATLVKSAEINPIPIDYLRLYRTFVLYTLSLLTLAECEDIEQFLQNIKMIANLYQQI